MTMFAATFIDEGLILGFIGQRRDGGRERQVLMNGKDKNRGTV